MFKIKKINNWHPKSNKTNYHDVGIMLGLRGESSLGWMIKLSQ